MTLIPVLRAGRYLMEQHEVTRPWEPRAYRSPALESAAADNLVDEVEAFRNFAVTRAGRRITRYAVGGALSFGYYAAGTQWLRYTIKGVTRFVPVIGWGLLAYDLYNLGEDLDLY